MNQTLLQSKKSMIFAGLTVLIVLLVIAAIFFPTLKQTTIKTDKPTNTAIAVDVQVAQRKDLVKKISLVGQTVSEAQIDIAAKYSGRVSQVLVDLGQSVSAGQVLLVQDTGDVDLSIAQNQAGLRQAQADTLETQSTFNANSQKLTADYQRSLTSYNRYKELYEIGGISRETLDTSEQQMVNAKAALDTLLNQTLGTSAPAAVDSKQAAAVKVERTIDALAKQRDDLVLRAPRDGIISYRQVEVGAFVTTGQKLLSLVDNSNLYIECQLSEQDTASLQLNMPTIVDIESLGRSFPGKIIFISPAKDATTLTFKVRLALTSTEPILKSGMFARSSVDVLLRPQAILVPQEAIITKNGKTSVYIINAQNQAVEKTVQLGLRNDTEVEIISGITIGDQIALNNLAKLKSGITVAVTVHTTEQDGVQ